MKKKVALVLSGGGAKGCYEIGAWKALREAGYEFDAVVGSSVGCLNAALIVQDDYDLAEKLWDSISIDQVVKVPNNIIKDGSLDIRFNNLKEFSSIHKMLIKGKLDSTPLRDLLNKYIDERLIRSKEVDLGIVTYNISGLKPIALFLDRIKEGQLADYIFASASFPAFKSTTIDGKKFIDGGVHDNIPFRMVKNRGYKKIVVIDISGMGINRKPDIIGTETLYIKNSLEFGTASDFYGIFKFKPTFLRDFRELGYLDTQKALGHFLGHRYFIEFDPKKINEYEKEVYSKNGIKLVTTFYRNFLSKKVIKNFQNSKIDIYQFIQESLPSKMKGGKYSIIAYLECAAFCFGLEVLKSWSIEELVNQIEIELDLLSKKVINRSEIELKQYTEFIFSSNDIDKRAQKMYSSDNRLPTPFEYEKAAIAIAGKSEAIRKRALKAILIKFPQLLPARIICSLLFDFKW